MCQYLYIFPLTIWPVVALVTAARPEPHGGWTHFYSHSVEEVEGADIKYRLCKVLSWNSADWMFGLFILLCLKYGTVNGCIDGFFFFLFVNKKKMYQIQIQMVFSGIQNFELKQLKKGGTWTEEVNTKEINWYPIQKVTFARRKLQGANPATITRYCRALEHIRGAFSEPFFFFYL